MSTESSSVKQSTSLKSHSASLKVTSTSWSDKYKWIMALMALALYIRLSFVRYPQQVVFDEVHFGKFATKYLARENAFDVHPPLGKLLLALPAWIAGFKGQFGFDFIGQFYTENVPYTAMRVTSALFGVALIPTAFLTMLESGVSQEVAGLISLCLVGDNALTTQSRFILLDSSLLFFMSLSFYFWTKWKKTDQFISMVLTGITLGAAISVKWTGLNLLPLYGIYGGLDLWRRFCALEPLGKIGKRAVLKGFGYLVIPSLIYIASFWIHFQIIQTCDEVSLWGMSPEFRHACPDQKLQKTYADVVYGSQVAIRQKRNEDGPYLHSHAYLWPEGSKQQQVTGYAHHDDHNYWIIQNAFSGTPVVDGTPVRSGDLVRLKHVITGRHLHSHANISPPISDKEHHMEVTCYGSEDHSDHNDNWYIEIVDDNGVVNNRAKGTPIMAIKSGFRLCHQMTRCYLQASGKNLPQYGFGQIEITCGKDTLRKNSVWRIEQNDHMSLAEKSPLVSYEPASFFSRFKELNARMWKAHGSLDGTHPHRSAPWEWPLLLAPVGMWTGQQGPPKNVSLMEEEKLVYSELLEKNIHSRIVLIGNPILWASAFTGLVVYFIGLMYGKWCSLQGYTRPVFFSLDSDAGALVLFWATQYIPFFAIHRPLFLHHYLPAFYASILLLSQLLDYILPLRIKKNVTGTLTVLVFATFMAFYPLSYGVPMTRPQCERLSWLSSWAFSCSGLPGPVRPTPKI